MNKLIIIAGASGAGKSFLMSEISKINKKIVPIKKMSTRAPREHELKPNSNIDIEFDCTINDIKSECDFIYTYGRETYGIRKQHIDNALEEGATPFVIVRDCMEIQNIKAIYKNRTIAIYLHNAFSGEELRKKLEELGRSDIDITIRNQRSRYDCINYQKFINEFDAALINDFEDDSIVQQLKEVIKNEKLKDMRIKGRIFVLMSFAPERERYYKSMKWAVRSFNDTQKRNLYIHRVDDGQGRYTITEAIIQHIKEAELIVCDLTHERQNVYYELGYATALNKPVLLLAEKGTKLYFDIAGDNVHFYQNTDDLSLIVERFLQTCFTGSDEKKKIENGSYLL